MARGPDKSFDPDAALGKAMHLFWEKGFAATSMAELQTRTGLGAKSLYDTFGNKRALYFGALRHYTETVVQDLFGDLSEQASPLAAANGILQTMRKLSARHHRGCLLGVAMAQAQVSDDEELAAFIDTQLREIEDALFAAFEHAKARGELPEPIDARDMAQLYTAAFQGVNLISRVRKDHALTDGANRALTVLSTHPHR